MMTKPTDSSCPSEILDWLPWYADDGLSERQRGAVEAHAAGCEPCRTEIAMLRGNAIPEVDAPDWEPAFAKVLARIESAGPEASVVAGGHRVPAPARHAPRRAIGGMARSRVFSRIAAAAALIVVGAIGWVAHDWSRPANGEVYQTAAGPDADAIAPAGALQIDVVFRTDVPIARINTNLRALGAEVVSGPSEAGRYRLALPAGSNPAAAAAMLRAEDSGVATFAEPVRP